MTREGFFEGVSSLKLSTVPSSQAQNSQLRPQMRTATRAPGFRLWQKCDGVIPTSFAEDGRGGTVRCDWIASDEDGTGNGALRRHLPDGFRATAEAS
jgi:hypothetical protein